MKSPNCEHQAKLDVFGRIMVVKREGDSWLLFNYSQAGFVTRNRELVIPTHLALEEIPTYLDDMFHEHASPKHPVVRLIKG